jgi:hypothetical protein
MIDKILMAARRLAVNYQIHKCPAGAPPEFFTPDEKRLAAEINAKLSGADLPEQVIETDVDAFDELVRLVADYFNPGRSPSTTCKYCDAPLIWVKTSPGGKNAPLDVVPIQGIDADGITHRIYLNHFSTCPHAERVRCEKKAHAAALPVDGKSKAAR